MHVGEIRSARAAHDHGRLAAERGAWRDAYEALTHADATGALEPHDLELLATSAYMLGRDDEYVRALERAHYAHLDAGNVARAARCTWWIGLDSFMRGAGAPASGWFARGERLLDRDELDCAERGYLRLGRMLEHFRVGDYEAARVAAAEAVEIGQRFGERDLVAMGVMDQGHALLELGRTAEGLRLIDESMVAVTSGELSPIVAGILYCNTIAVCRGCYELRRAREWTTALTRWCESEPGMVAHQGVCLVHRAEIMQLEGAWEAALDEAARVAGTVSSDGRSSRKDSGRALCVQGDLHRLRGDFEAAEEAYRDAARLGCEPQPGLALLRLAQGDARAALAAIRRALGETAAPLRRVSLLQASVEIALDAGEVAEAGRWSDELAQIAEATPSTALTAMADQARGAVALAHGDPAAALTALRAALDAWEELSAPYESARTRMLVGLACAALGDDDTAAVDLQAARGVLAELGARPDLARLDALTSGAPADTHGLSRRELQVLRRLASGETNREIATALVLSERTVDRHVSNLYAKLGVSSRAAATAYAYEHRLL